MKFIISASTVAQLNDATAEIACLVAGCTDITAAPIEADDTHANHSIKLIDGDYVVEINDEGLLKYMALYLKVAKAIAPFIKPIMGLMTALKDDVRELEAFFSAKK